MRRPGAILSVYDCPSGASNNKRKKIFNIPFIVLAFCYAYKGGGVNCKSEGNILVVENEEKGDVHFCKTDQQRKLSKCRNIITLFVRTFFQTLHCLIDLAFIIKLRSRRERTRGWTSGVPENHMEYQRFACAACLESYVKIQFGQKTLWLQNLSVLYFLLYHNCTFPRGKVDMWELASLILAVLQSFRPLAAGVSRSLLALLPSLNKNQKRKGKGGYYFFVVKRERRPMKVRQGAKAALAAR